MSEQYEVPFPFHLKDFPSWNDDGHTMIQTFTPGIRMVQVGVDDVEAIADGMGKMVLTVVRHRTRVFYTRQWVDPNGKHFGKSKLRVTTQAAFTRMVSGYRSAYRLAKEGE